MDLAENGFRLIGSLLGTASRLCPTESLATKLHRGKTLDCDDGILFKSVFYRKCDAIHSVWTAFQDYVLY